MPPRKLRKTNARVSASPGLSHPIDEFIGCAVDRILDGIGESLADSLRSRDARAVAIVLLEQLRASQLGVTSSFPLVASFVLDVTNVASEIWLRNLLELVSRFAHEGKRRAL